MSNELSDVATTIAAIRNIEYESSLDERIPAGASHRNAAGPGHTVLRPVTRLIISTITATTRSR
jgi:hypothetical protein